MHLKRQNIGKFWPIPRKGTKYLAVASHNQKDSIPLIVVMREMLGLVKSKKELQKLINEKQIKINRKEIRDVNYPLCLFDKLTLVDSKKNYRVSLSKNKKFILEEVSDKVAEKKLYKVMSKKMLPGKKIQLNLMHNKNILSNEKVNTGDSILFNFKENKIDEVVTMEKGKKGFVIEGKHAGYQGMINDIMERGGKRIAKIISDEGKINVWTKNVVALE